MGVVVIVGATGGVGQALTARLRREGHELVLGARREDGLSALATEAGYLYKVTDATDFASVEELFSLARDRYERVDGAVNLAGSLLLKPAHLTSADEWENTIRQNLTTAFNTAKAAIKSMSFGGSVVLMSSAAARTGLANHEAIAAAKAGVQGLTISAAATYASRGIRFNCIAPGLVDTPLTARITGNELAFKASVGMHALGRVGNGEDIASAIAWLLNPENSWVTGQIFGIDGGLGTIRPR